MFKMLRSILLFTIILCVACSTIPITQRSQLMLVSKAEEEKMGLNASIQFLNQPGTKGKLLSWDHPSVIRVRRVAGKIAYINGLTGDYKWTCGVIDDPSIINAGMYPGGKLIVYTGLLNFTAGSDDELAAVLAHETAHAMARHGAERFSQVIGVQLISTTLDTVLTDSKYQGAVHAAFGLGSQFGILLPYSRLHESEADYMGLLYMAKAQYDPEAAIRFWERMEREHRTSQIAFFSTHPSHGIRINNLKQWLPQALDYKKNPWKTLRKE